MEINFNLKYVSVAFNKVVKIYSKVNTTTRDAYSCALV